MQSSAELSRDQVYRYRLDRWWGDGPRLPWVMLNPSTADASKDDPTIRRCIRFSRELGYDGLTVVNVFGVRTPNPMDIRRYRDRWGPDWAGWFWGALVGAEMVIAAWGSNVLAKGAQGTDDLLDRLTPITPVMCFGTTKDGSPRHPLYVPANADLIPWTVAERGEGD